MPPRKRPRASPSVRDQSEAEAEHQNAMQDITTRARFLRVGDVEAEIERIENKWGVDLKVLDTISGHERINKVFEAIQQNLLQCSSCGDLVYRDIVRCKTLEITEIAALRTQMKHLEVYQELRDRIDRLYECAHYSSMAAILANRAAIACHPLYDTRVMNDDTLLLRFDGPPSYEDDDKDLSALHKLVLYLLEIMRTRGYKRYREHCYDIVLTREGHPTQAWRQVCSIRDLAYKETSQDVSMSQMRNALSRGDNISSAVQYLSEVEDWRFPDLLKDRRLFAFSNGLYITTFKGHQDRFIRYTDTDPSTSSFKGRAACKFFDMPMNEDHLKIPWHSVPTPAFQAVLKSQGMGSFDEEGWEITRWMYVMVGRLLHEVGAHDNWQLALFLKGIGDTGKSTIIKSIISRFFENVDVGHLDNNTERQWSLSSFYDKLLFVAPEVKRDFKLDQGSFQTMTSGESCGVARKHQIQLDLPRWIVPGVFAGNELPGWIDNAGSVSRRWLLFRFDNVVKDKDTTLDAKLQQELPQVILKCNRAYLEAVDEVGSGDIWKAMPKYFMEGRNSVASMCNPLEDFITCGKVELGADKFVSWGDFCDAFHEHEIQNNLRKNQLTVDVYGPIFARHKMKRVPKEVRDYNNARLSSIWVDGCELATQVVTVGAAFF